MLLGAWRCRSPFFGVTLGSSASGASRIFCHWRLFNWPGDEVCLAAHQSGLCRYFVGTLSAAIAALVIGYFMFSAGVRAAYFVVATLALSIIVEQTVKSFSNITGGWNGLYVDRMTLTFGSLFERSLFDDVPMYYTVLAVVVLVYLATITLMRSSFGADRDRRP